MDGEIEMFDMFEIDGTMRYYTLNHARASSSFDPDNQKDLCFLPSFLPSCLSLNLNQLLLSFSPTEQPHPAKLSQHK